jgi:hypothetical protein
MDASSLLRVVPLVGRDTAMLALIAVPIVCWLCILLVWPRRPRAGDEVNELAYIRALRRRQWLAFLATALTVVTLVAIVTTTRIDSPAESAPAPMETPAAPQATPAYCVGPANSPPTCYRVESDGTWTRMEFRDGQWVPAAVMTKP